MSNTYVQNAGRDRVVAEAQPAEDVPVMEETKKAVAGGPLKVRNFQLLFGGQTISVMGDALYLVALPGLVLTTSGSAQARS